MLTCREPDLASKAEACPISVISLRVNSECCAGGARHKGGRDSVSGSSWELREPVIMIPREKVQAAITARPRVPMHDTGAELPVVVRKRL